MQTKAIYTISLLLLFTGLIGLPAQAQQSRLVRQTISICGGTSQGTINGDHILVQQSVGQGSPIGTYHSNKRTLRQGFLQPQTKHTRVLQKEELNVSLHPNPFWNELNVVLEKPRDSPIQIQLLDLSGRLIKSEQRNAGEILQFNWSEIENGAYLLHIQIDQIVSITNIQKL